MSLTSQLRATLMIAVLPLVQIGCASVPQVESRLQTWQLSPTVYSARPGDTLATVAFRYKIDEAQLRAMNPQLPDQLVTGQRVVVHQSFDAQSAVQTASAAPIQSPGQPSIAEPHHHYSSCSANANLSCATSVGAV